MRGRGEVGGWAGGFGKGSERGSGFLLMSAFNSDRLSLLLSISLPLHLLASSADQGRSRSISSKGGRGARVRHECVDVSAPPAPSEMGGGEGGSGGVEEERKREDVKATATAVREPTSHHP